MNNEQLASEILKYAGGEENVTYATHCMTRLRLKLKDDSLAEIDSLKKISGVLGVIHSGGQLQVIIGQNVPNVYMEVKNMVRLESSDSTIKEKQPVTFKSVGNGILDALSGSLTPVIPLIMAASIFKMLVVVLGPDLLGVLSSEGDIYNLLVMVGDAGFYFLPIIVGYTSAKKFGANVMLGMFLGAILMHPTMTTWASEGMTLNLFGIPMLSQNYASTIFPIIMSVYVMSYIERVVNKILPNTLRTVFSPALIIMVMLPITLCILGPLGSYMGIFVGNFLLSLDKFGFLAVAIIAAMWQFLVMSGMHIVLITTMIVTFSTVGYDSLVSPAAGIASVGLCGIALGAALRLKSKEEKSLCFGYLISALIGGVSEPTLYGVCMKYKRPLLIIPIAGFLGGLYGGITGVTTYALVPVASVFGLTGFLGGDSANFINAVIATLICFVSGAVLTYFFGFTQKQMEGEL